MQPRPPRTCVNIIFQMLGMMENYDSDGIAYEGMQPRPPRTCVHINLSLISYACSESGRNVDNDEQLASDQVDEV